VSNPVASTSLVEVNYFERQNQPTASQIRFWFRELRTPELLIEMAQIYRRVLSGLVRQRPLLTLARDLPKAVGLTTRRAVDTGHSQFHC
jgi:hypothetical protein